jgi:hypothetical protein
MSTSPTIEVVEPHRAPRPAERRRAQTHALEHIQKLPKVAEQLVAQRLRAAAFAAALSDGAWRSTRRSPPEICLCGSGRRPAAASSSSPRSSPQTP